MTRPMRWIRIAWNCVIAVVQVVAMCKVVWFVVQMAGWCLGLRHWPEMGGFWLFFVMWLALIGGLDLLADTLGDLGAALPDDGPDDDPAESDAPTAVVLQMRRQA